MNNARSSTTAISSTLSHARTKTRRTDPVADAHRYDVMNNSTLEDLNWFSVDPVIGQNTNLFVVQQQIPKSDMSTHTFCNSGTNTYSGQLNFFRVYAASQLEDDVTIWLYTVTQYSDSLQSGISAS